MECFYHAGHPSVGVCRSCFRGLCRQCAVDLDRALACRDRCETFARALIATLDLSTKYRGVAPGASVLWNGIALVALMTGIFVLIWGLRLPVYREVALLSVPFLLIALLLLRVGRVVTKG